MSCRVKMALSKRNAAAHSSARELPFPPSNTKSLVWTHLAKHCGVWTICDGGNGNSLAHSFIWLSPMIPCSVAAGVTVVALAPKCAEHRELGSCSHNVSLYKRDHSPLAPNIAERREVGSWSSLSNLIYGQEGTKTSE